MRLYWGKILAVPIAVASLGMTGVVVIHGPAETSSTWTAVAATATQPPPKPTVALFVGDSYSAGYEGISSNQTFPCRVARAMHWICNLDAEGGTGYVSKGIVSGYSPYQDRLESRDAGNLLADYVIVSGGRNDGGNPHVSGAAHDYFQAVRAYYPAAKLVVVEPFWGNDDPDPAIVALRAHVHAAAEAAKATWVPTGGWLNESLLIGDRVHPTLRGQAVITAKLTKALRAAGVPAGACTDVTPGC